MPDADAPPPAAVEAVMRSICDDIYGPAIWDRLTPESMDSFRSEAARRVTAALPALRAQWEGEIKAAFCEGYDTGSDPAWCEKQLRRAGVKAETWEPAATDYFWQGSEAAAALRAPTTSYPLSPEAQLSTDSLSEPTAPSREAP